MICIGFVLFEFVPYNCRNIILKSGRAEGIGREPREAAAFLNLRFYLLLLLKQISVQGKLVRDVWDCICFFPHSPCVLIERAGAEPCGALVHNSVKTFDPPCSVYFIYVFQAFFTSSWIIAQNSRETV